MRIVLVTCLVAVASAAVPIGTFGQRNYQKQEIVALTHFNMATFVGGGNNICNAENWADSHHPKHFNPARLNVSNWMESYRALGARSALLTAKHGCGFLLYPTKTTLPSGERFYYDTFGPGAIQRDVLREFVDACKANGLGFGFYYNLKTSYFFNVQNGQPLPPATLQPGQYEISYEDYSALSLAQEKELWTQYGNLTEIWFDGGVLPDIANAIQVQLRETQPNVAAFNGYGASDNPTCWDATESGSIGSHLYSQGNVTGTGNPFSDVYCPKTCDTTLQENDAWFFAPTDAIRSLQELIQVYHNTVGNNGVLELDFGINTDGLVEPSQAARYLEFGNWIRSCYGQSVAESSENAQIVTVALPAPTEIDRVMVQEDIDYGEVIRAYVVEYQTSSSGSVWNTFGEGTGVGFKTILLGKSVSDVTRVRLTVTVIEGPLHLTRFAVFKPCPFA